jgi:hypothetical protein
MMMVDGSLLQSGGETWGPVWPDNVHETGVSLDGQSAFPIVAARRSRSSNSKNDLVKGPDPRVFVPFRPTEE